MTGTSPRWVSFTVCSVRSGLLGPWAPGPPGPGKGRREAGSVWVAPARQGGGLEPRPDVAVGWGT